MTTESTVFAGLQVVPIHRLAAPLRHQVLERLRREIIEGRLAPGTRLIERQLIGILDVSRTVVREALRQLESEGLVALVPHKGPVVRELTLVEANDLYQIRAVLEGLAVRRFVENAADAQVKMLAQAFELVADAYAAGDVSEVLEAKNHFYDVLFEGAQSETLSAMLNMLHGRIRRWRALGLSHPERSSDRSKESVRNLRSTLAAIRKRDGDTAERTIRAEVGCAADEVMRLLAAPSPRSERGRKTGSKR